MKTTDQLREEARQAILAYKVRWRAEKTYYFGVSLDCQKEILCLQDIDPVELARLIREERVKMQS